MIEFEKVTTRGGDRGETSLYSGERRRKDDLIFDALGDVDEVSCELGVVRASLADEEQRRVVFFVQQVLFKVGAELATPISDALYDELAKTSSDDIEAVEFAEKQLLSKVEIGPRFVTPGDSLPSAFVHRARSVTRRAERSTVRCIRERGMVHLSTCQNFLNRTSDYLFVLAIAIDQGVSAVRS